MTRRVSEAEAVTKNRMSISHSSGKALHSRSGDKAGSAQASRTARVRKTEKGSRPVMSPLEIVEKASSLGFWRGSDYILDNTFKDFHKESFGKQDLLEQTGEPALLARLIDRVRSYGNLSHEQFQLMLFLTSGIGRHTGPDKNEVLYWMFKSASDCLKGGDSDLVFTMNVLGDHWDALRTRGGSIGALREEAFARFESGNVEQQARLRTAFMLPHEARLFRSLPDTMWVYSGGSYPELYANRYFTFEEAKANTDARTQGKTPAVLSGVVSKAELLGLKVGVRGPEVVLAATIPARWNIDHSPRASKELFDTEDLLARLTQSAEATAANIQLSKQRSSQTASVGLN